jgi:hypothetical protein
LSVPDQKFLWKNVHAQVIIYVSNSLSPLKINAPAQAGRCIFLYGEDGLVDGFISKGTFFLRPQAEANPMTCWSDLIINMNEIKKIVPSAYLCLYITHKSLLFPQSHATA